MSDLYFWIAMDVNFLAGSIWAFWGPSKRHIDRLQASRPEWTYPFCRQFFYVMRTLFAALAIVLTFYLALHAREVAQ